MGCKCTKDSVFVHETKYYIIERIADGGFGTIDLVEDKNGLLYALKRIKCSSKEDTDKACIENSYYKRFNNPNIIKLINDDIVLDRINSTYIIYMVMPYYQSGTMQDEIERSVRKLTFMSDDLIVRLMLGVCNALDNIHKEKLAHRDLKPQNILLNDSKIDAILADFGSMSESIIRIANAHKAQEIQDWASENCSMFYKAPELFVPQEYQEITESADIWSFGCNLYAAMYNKGPFDYVLERGDSIALAVSNARFTIPDRPARNERLINLVKNTVIVNPNERISLNRIRLELIELASIFHISI